MRRRDAELQSDTQGPLQRHPPSALPNGRGEGGSGGEGEERREGGGGWGGGVLPERLKSGSGHHHLEVLGPSNGRHKLVYRRPDFFALLHSPSSAIDALDTLY